MISYICAVEWEPGIMRNLQKRSKGKNDNQPYSSLEEGTKLHVERVILNWQKSWTGMEVGVDIDTFIGMGRKL